MARSKKKSTRRAVPTTVAAPWEQNTKVVQATRKILELERRTAKQVVDAVVEVGGRLAEVKEWLPHGEWERWLERGVHFDPRTARRYLSVHEWARTNPRSFARVRTLSISKVYRLLVLAPADRRRLIEHRTPIPDTILRLKAEEMTITQLDDVIRSMRATPPPADPVAPLLESAERHLAGFESQAEALIDHRAHVDPDAIAALHTTLLELTQRLESAFAL